MSSENLKEDLSQLTFADRLFIKEKLGLKVFNNAMYNDDNDTSGNDTVEAKPKTKRSSSSMAYPKSRDMSDDSPMEMPIAAMKKKIKNMRKKREPTQQHHRVTRDPRFDDLSGTFNETYFQKAYSFLSEVKEREKSKLSKFVKHTHDDEKKNKAQSMLTSMKQQEENKKVREQKREKLKEIRKKERELIEQGKSPYYIKKNVLKKMQKEEDVNKLKSSGQYNKHLLRKEKKKLSKERKSTSFLQ